MKRGEFSLITRYFNPVKTPSRLDVEIGIGDDCAILNVPEKNVLAVSSDTLVCGRHFLPEIDPADLAYKALAVNISDLAAMGADPAWLTLALTLPRINEAWLEIFSSSLFNQLNYYNMQLVGGDITSGPLSLTLTIHGFLPLEEKINVLTRSGAKPGDLIYVTGTVGDSAAGLAILKNQLKVSDINDKLYLIKRHLRPTPRVMHGRILLGYASSAIDLSDGLILNLEHILKASNVGARIDLNSLPMSPAMCKIDLERAFHWALSGGEDYELLFTLPESYLGILDTLLGHLNTIYTCIGKILPENKGLQFIKREDVILPIDYKKGYDHFYDDSLEDLS